MTLERDDDNFTKTVFTITLDWRDSKIQICRDCSHPGPCPPERIGCGKTYLSIQGTDINGNTNRVFTAVNRDEMREICMAFLVAEEEMEKGKLT